MREMPLGSGSSANADGAMRADNAPPREPIDGIA